jgi:hypothetical protein
LNSPLKAWAKKLRIEGGFVLPLQRRLAFRMLTKMSGFSSPVENSLLSNYP